MAISKIFLQGICLVFCMIFSHVSEAVPLVYDEFIVNNPLSGGSADHATVAMNKSGDIFIVWTESSPVAPDVVKGKMVFGTTGLSSPITLISTPEAPYSNIVPDIANDGKNRYIVVWASEHPSGFYQVKAKLFNNGVALGGEFVVNDDYLKNGLPAPSPWPNPDAKQSYPTYKTFLHTSFPDVTMNASGDFIVVWDQWDGSQQNRYIRQFGRNGTAKSQSIQLNTFATTLAYSGLPDVDMNEQGDVIVAWSEDYLGTSAIAYRYLNLAAGAIVGDESLIHPPVAGFHQVRPMVSINASGEALISWSEIPADSSPTFVYASTFDVATKSWSVPFSPQKFVRKANRVTGVMLSTGEVLLGYSAFIYGSKDIVAEKFASPPVASSSMVINQTQAGLQRRAAFSLLEGNAYNWLITTWEDDNNNHSDIYCRIIGLNP